jgi:hypothetical protein
MTTVPKERTRSKVAMRVSAVRFGADLWQLLEDEATAVGVSVAQYVREASLARAVAAAAARGEDPHERLAAAARKATPTHADDARTPKSRRAPQDHIIERATAARRKATAARSGAEAVIAQSEQATLHASALAPPPRPRRAAKSTSASRPAPQLRGKR